MGATGGRRIGRLQVDGASQRIDGVEPEVSGGSQAPMNGLGKEKGPMRGHQSSDILAFEIDSPTRTFLARDRYSNVC